VVTVPVLPGEVIGRECGNPILAGSAVDLRFAADLTTRAALDELAAAPGESPASGQTWNSLVWTREPLSEAGHGDLRRPYGTVLQRIPPHPGCPVCPRPRTTRVVMATSAEADLRRYAEDKIDRETGSALIGFEAEGGCVVILEVTDAGPKCCHHPRELLPVREGRAGDRVGDHY
jgi:hypothetical protein